MKVHYFCLKYRTKIPDQKYFEWCSRQDCWALRPYSKIKKLNKIKMSMNPEQIRNIRHVYYATRKYIGGDCNYK